MIDASSADPQRHAAILIGDMNQILEGHAVFALDAGEVTKAKTCFASIPCFWKESLADWTELIIRDYNYYNDPKRALNYLTNACTTMPPVDDDDGAHHWSC